MEPTLSSETSAFILRTPGKFPKEHRLHSEHGENLKTTFTVKCRLYVFGIPVSGMVKSTESLDRVYRPVAGPIASNLRLPECEVGILTT